MREEEFLEYLTDVEDWMLQEAAAPKHHRMLRRFLAVAAMLSLVLLTTVTVTDKLNIGRMGCGASLGTIVDGTYYFRNLHKGVYSYKPGEKPHMEVSEWLVDSWRVNERGLFYMNGRRVYRKDLNTGKNRNLYTAGLFTQISIEELREDGALIVGIRDKWNNTYSQVQIYEDGEAEEQVKTLIEPIPYEEHWEIMEETTQEQVDSWISGQELLDSFELTGRKWYLGSSDKYLFYYLQKDQDTEHPPLYCVETATGEDWEITYDQGVDIYQAIGDSDYLYTCVPWSGGRTDCWKLVYDENGKLTALELICNDIEEAP